MEIVEGDLFDVTEGAIVHQVNCRGVMGSGVARAIRDRWPIVYEQYRRWFSFGYQGTELLGQCQVVNVGDGLFVVNLFGQDNYGNGGLHTDYAAVATAFKWIAGWRTFDGDVAVHIPYMMGCDRAGGDWATYSRIVDEHCPGVTAHRLPSERRPA